MTRPAVRASLVMPVLLAVLLAPAVARAEPFTQVVVFGDSLSDAGNIYAFTGGAFPASPPYAMRMSNGPVAVEYLAAALGAPLVNVAFAGAGTGTTNIGGDELPGMRTMYESYVAPIDPAALYVVWGGANDFMSGALTEGAILESVSNLLFIAGDLAASGAQHILVPGMPDLGATPRAHEAGPVAQAVLSEFTAAFNAELLMALGTFVPRATFFDTAAFLARVLANPEAFGFANVIAPCKTDPAEPGLPGTVCADPDSYLFWDDVHPTTAAHRALAREFGRAVVPEPATLLLVLAGFGVLAGRRRLASGGRATRRAPSPNSHA